MPFPVVAAVPAIFASLVGAIGAMFTGLLTWFMTWSTRRLIILVGVVAATVALAAAFFAMVDSLIDALYVASPTELQQAVGMFFPDNIDQCIAAIITLHSARYVLLLKTRFLQIKAGT